MNGFNIEEEFFNELLKKENIKNFKIETPIITVEQYFNIFDRVRAFIKADSKAGFHPNFLRFVLNPHLYGVTKEQFINHMRNE